MSASPGATLAAPVPRRIRLWGIAILVALAALIVWQPAWHARLQAAAFDGYQLAAPRRVESMPATVVDIDEKSLAALGQWPWPRTTLAKLIREIARHQPLAIGIDILMPEPDRLSPQRLLDLAERKEPSLERELAKLPSNDTELASAIAAAPVVLGIAGTNERTAMPLRTSPVVVHDAAARAVTPSLPAALHLEGVVTSLDEIDRAAIGHGLISVEPSSNVVRRVPLVFEVNGTLAPALPLEMLRVALNVPGLRLHSRGPAVTSLALGDFLAPTEEDGAVRIYYSPHDPRRYVPAVDVLKGNVDPERLRQKLVLIGTTGLGLADFHATPLDLPMPGAEIHAQVLENLVDRTLLARPAWARIVELSLLLIPGALLIWAVPRWQPRDAALLAGACVLLPPIVGYAAFHAGRLLFDAATPALSLMLLFTALLVLTLVEATRRRRSLERVVQAQREEAARISGELQAAQRIQSGMLPRADSLANDKRVDLATTMIPAREVGGDLYDFFPLDDRRLFFLIGDVAGKGLSASIFMAISKALYKSATLRMASADAGKLMSAANAEVSRDNPEMLFVTAFAGILDLDSGELAYCNAGNEDPYLLFAGDAAIRRLEDGGGPPLCARDDFPYRSARYAMRPGEVICLVTDGVTDAQNRDGEMYGRERLRSLLERARTTSPSAQAVTDAVRADVESFASGTEAADDLTVLALRWTGSGC